MIRFWRTLLDMPDLAVRRFSIRNFLSYRLYLDDDHSGLEKLCLAELVKLLSGLASNT